MDISLFLKSVGVGLAVAAPVGPMSLLCMRTTLARGWPNGFAVGAGIAVGDAVFAAIAALGLAGLSAFMLANDRALHVAAGLFLTYLGARSIWRKPVDDEGRARTSNASISRDFASSILLTLANPPTIIMFAAVFAALAPKDGLSLAGAATTSAGVFAGSILWWLVVVGAFSALRGGIGARARLLIDRASGAALVLLGLAELWRGATAPPSG